ncbi:MAG: twin-arginine translocase TatA/TatE family subunit [Thermodesulfobacteriota bacterium]|nr:twin-arginine translocase TatA/TatE family subunit [Thermodesulfobacteriota bacterium]
MILGLGSWELLLLGILVTALFGLKRLPAAARDLGRLHGFSRRIKRKFGWLSRFL